MSARALRDININMRTTAKEKSLLARAAEIAGFSNLTNFIMTAARKEANRVLADTHVTYVTERDWELVNRLLAEAPAPNQKLKDLLNKE